MAVYYLAVDIGASSGRHILGHLKNGKIILEEIYRFENGMEKRKGKLLWDTKRLFSEIINGMKLCKTQNKIPVSMSIDTWAVDYVLLDKDNNLLGDTWAYRDSRTANMDKEVYRLISEKSLYQRTGIQKQMFNTIYQLMAVKKQEPELLKQAETFLMLPDYFQFLLTGNRVSEYTNAVSTQLVNPVSRQWDMELIYMLGYHKKRFLPLQMPGTKVGNLKKEIQNQVGFDCEITLCASHDTASAVMAIPEQQVLKKESVVSKPASETMEIPIKQGIYLSSGTWSLMGVEIEQAICDEESRLANFTNEGGYEYRFRYLKNIMGLWMIQSVRHELNNKYSFSELCKMAEEHQNFSSRINVNHTTFLAPKNMTAAIQDYCRKTNQPVPETAGELAAVIYQSLADCYKETAKELEKNTKKIYNSIQIIGGGSNAAYLNQLTANASKKTVYAGPAEATAIGNLIAQMIQKKELKSLKDARKCVSTSFDIQIYQPVNR